MYVLPALRLQSQGPLDAVLLALDPQYPPVP